MSRHWIREAERQQHKLQIWTLDTLMLGKLPLNSESFYSNVQLRAGVARMIEPMSTRLLGLNIVSSAQRAAALKR